MWLSITRTEALCFTTCCESEGEHTSPACSHVSRLHTLLLLIPQKHCFHLPPSLQPAIQTLPLHLQPFSPNLLHPCCTSEAEEARAEPPGNTQRHRQAAAPPCYTNNAFKCKNIKVGMNRLWRHCSKGAGRECHLVLNPKNPAFVLFGLACVRPNPSIC